ncbi:MAG: LysR family transcriptional regulator [Ancalomicrobiaceae bacterium]|nr:LysR family transcriptional regulator [Ancalomicrobiaceae bacterium]
MISLRLYLSIEPETRIGPGKVRLLEEVGASGSISAAARTLGMTYRRAWELIHHMNEAFGQPIVTGTTGSLGGAELTDVGREIITRYREIEQQALKAAEPHLAALSGHIVAPSGPNDD